jgi:lipid-binding SYLF domain-containing protein
VFRQIALRAWLDRVQAVHARWAAVTRSARSRLWRFWVAPLIGGAPPTLEAGKQVTGVTEGTVTTHWMRLARSAACLAVTALVLGTGSARGESKDDERSEVRKAAKETLSRLYKVQPSAKKAVEKAAGYAVFNNFGMKILFAGGGSGKGLAVDNATKKITYMKMVEVQAGLGMGVKKFSLIWVFETREALRQFVDAGWELGAQSSAAATKSGEGGSLTGAMSPSPGVWLYQLVNDGLALELTAKGTKYYKDNDLN